MTVEELPLIVLYEHWIRDPVQEPLIVLYGRRMDDSHAVPQMSVHLFRAVSAERSRLTRASLSLSLTHSLSLIIALYL